MTVREHLGKAHEQIAEHHTFKAAHHRAMAGHYSKLARFHKAAGMEGGEDAAAIYEDMADSHHKSADNHDEHAKFHKAQMKECEKAAASDLNKLVPDNVRGIVTQFPNVTPVPRHGAPQIEKAVVDPMFQHLVEID